MAVEKNSQWRATQAYCYSNQINKWMGGHEARMMVMGNVYKILAEKPQQNRRLVRPKRWRKYNIKRDHHHHISVMELGHLLTRSGLTYPEVSSKICHDSFCQLGNSVSLPWVIYYGAFYLPRNRLYSVMIWTGFKWARWVSISGFCEQGDGKKKEMANFFTKWQRIKLSIWIVSL